MKQIIFSFLLFSFLNNVLAESITVKNNSQNNPAKPEKLKENRNWVDRTLPVGMTQEEFNKLQEEYKSLPPTARKAAKPAVQYNIGDIDYFWTQNQSAKNWYKIPAVCRQITSKSYIFVALTDNYSKNIWYNGSNNGYITQSDVDNISNEFTNNIYTKDINVFGSDPLAGLNGESRTTILLLDIDDSYSLNLNSIYLGGYFMGADTFSENVISYYGAHSNERKIIYVDTYPGIEYSYPNPPDKIHDISLSYRVLAHEFQHLINFYHDNNEETWVNEGCSGLAEYICGYGLRKPDNFFKNPDNPLTDWNGALIDYEQVALFFCYLYQQYGGVDTIKKIVSQQSDSIDGINVVLSSQGYPDRFYGVFYYWCAANYLQTFSGKFGYTDIDLSNYPFANYKTHSISSSFHVFESDTVSVNACKYIKFSNGLPLTLHYWTDKNIDGYIISKNNNSATIQKISEAISFSQFGSTINDIILIPISQADPIDYYYTTATLDPYEPNGKKDWAQNITFTDNFWTSQEANIGWNVDEDWFKFNGNKNETVTITCDVSSMLDAKIILYSDTNKLLTSDNYSSGIDEKIITYTLPNTGTFYIWIGYNGYLLKAAKSSDMSGSYTLKVNKNLAVASLTLSSPNGGENWIAMTKKNITWTSSNVVNVKLEYSTNNGSSWTQIVASTSAATGTYSWTVPNISTTQCLIRISDTSNSAIKDQSNAVFTILPVSVTLIFPGGGERWIASTLHDITWTSSNVVNVKLEYSTNNGSTWTQIIASTSAATGKYSWTVPNISSTQCLIRISNVSNPEIKDISDAVFTILPVSVSLTSPNGGERWIAGTLHDITWTNSNIVSIKLEYSTNNGTSWTQIVASVDAETGKYSWIVPNISTAQCLIRISDVSDASIKDQSNSVFTILPVFVTIISPNGGENIFIGANQIISWTAVNVTKVKIEYSEDNGINWSQIASNLDAFSGSYTWTIPEIESKKCIIRITDISNSTIKDLSDGTFIIKNLSSPSNFTGGYVTNNNGHQICLSWTLSPDDDLIEGYRIYRSQLQNFIDPAIDINTIVTIEELIEKEQNSTILIASIQHGKTEFLDDSIQLTGVLYYYWIEAFKGTSSSAKVQSGKITLVAEENPSSYSVNTPYPNPFNPVTTISFSVPKSGYVSLNVYSLAGQKVVTLVDGIIEKGKHEVTFDGSGLASGVYLYRFESGNFSKTGKMLLMK